MSYPYSLEEQIVTWCMSWYILGSKASDILNVLKTDVQRKKLIEHFEYRRDNKLPITYDIIYGEAVRIVKENPNE